MKGSLLTFVLLLSTSFQAINAQAIFETEIPFQENESWFGGAVGLGAEMPYLAPLREFDLALQNCDAQTTPLLISTRGRYIWSDKPFKFEIRERSLVIRSFYGIVEPVLSGRTLREAYMGACAKHFLPSGKLPDEMFFAVPQYNTRVELGYGQSQAGVVEYAEGIARAGLPAGVLTIDDGWQGGYGSFAFRGDRFPDPKAMVERLHALGFKVMLWVSPFVSPDSPEYRELAAKGYLVRQKNSDTPAVIEWRNGQSACYDLTNPDAQAYLSARLKGVQEEYGVDGFKFDCGDNRFYNPAKVRSFVKDATAVDHTRAWAETGLGFPFNEYSTSWQMGGQALVQRLGSGDNSLDALARIVPEMMAAGLLGYAYACPGVIGGDQAGSPAGGNAPEADQRIVVRAAQIHALMPMMQFSAAPWRVLNDGNMELVRKAVELHRRMAPYIMECARNAAATGEPIVRHLEFVFPGEGFADCRDQYMLGDRYLVAPAVDGTDHRDVRLPKGRWRDDQGNTYRGSTSISIKVPQGRIPYFEKL